ncbi:MAG TPA: CocE/NonD family hydrolase [Myxococcota bacterium]|nr:CocE/NonD family hydrolase [Myxococcota bacterium]
MGESRRAGLARIVAAALGLALAGAALGGDASWRADSEGAERHSAVYTRKSFYVQMRDGVRIAVDLYLPEAVASGARVPAILRMTRYWRAPRLRWFARPFADRPQPLAERFIAAGYAWLDVDVRGSGASGGVQLSLWSDDEVADGGELVDWIVRQPWSSGAVGALGDSYDGTAAELLLAAGRPAVRAVAPRFSLFDGYSDIAFPGGVRLEWFTREWGRFNDAIDRGNLWSAFPWWVPLFVSGPRPVDGPEGAAGVEAAQVAHAPNFDIARAASEIEFRDDVPPELGLPIAAWSPHGARRAAIEASGAAIYSVSGWSDGAYAHAAVKRFRSLRNPGSRLLLGPWNHGGDQQVDPLEPTRASDFDHAGELLRFFDFHLRGAKNGWDTEPRVRWFTTGEGRWKHGDSWPPPSSPTAFYLAAGAALLPGPPSEPEGTDSYVPDPASSSGTSTRWHALAVPTWTEYGDRSGADRHSAVYESAPLERDLEVTGHPILHLFLRADGSDAAVFAYLEDVTPDGFVGYVSEGQFRALHRMLRPVDKAPYAQTTPFHSFLRADARPLLPGALAELDFDLQPISHLFRRGHRLRLALAGADRDQFAPPPGAAAHWQISRGAAGASRLELPVVPRD